MAEMSRMEALRLCRRCDLDPHIVKRGSVRAEGDGGIWCEVFVLDGDGKVQVDPADPTQVLTREVFAPFKEESNG